MKKLTLGDPILTICLLIIVACLAYLGVGFMQGNACKTDHQTQVRTLEEYQLVPQENNVVLIIEDYSKLRVSMDFQYVDPSDGSIQIKKVLVYRTGNDEDGDLPIRIIYEEGNPHIEKVQEVQIYLWHGQEKEGFSAEYWEVHVPEGGVKYQ